MTTSASDRLTTIAGWTTPFPAGVLLLHLHPTPRPFGYRAQLALDLRGGLPWLYWLGGLGMIGSGVHWLATHYPAPATGFLRPWFTLLGIAAGVRLWLYWLRAIVNVVRWTRYEPLNVGTVTARPRPVFQRGFADAVRADGAAVQVTVAPKIIDGLLKAHGECEVLYVERPRAWAGTDSGFALAARPVPAAAGVNSGQPVDHWTSLPAAKRLELERTAATSGFVNDAVFFVLSAVTAARQRADGGRPATPTEVCRAVPELAARMFGSPAKAAAVLWAWGLRRGDDVGAVVDAFVTAGWLTYSAGERVEDFRGIDLNLDPAGAGVERAYAKEPPRRDRPTPVPGERRRALRAVAANIAYGALTGLVLLAAYVAWADRLAPEERPLLGRWYAANGDELRLVEFGADRSWNAEIIRRGDDVGPAERPPLGWWAACDGQILHAPPPGPLQRLGLVVQRDPSRFAMVTPCQILRSDAMVISRNGKSVVFRRVPPDIASPADLWPRRPADPRPQPAAPAKNPKPAL